MSERKIKGDFSLDFSVLFQFQIFIFFHQKLPLYSIKNMVEELQVTLEGIDNGKIILHSAENPTETCQVMETTFAVPHSVKEIFINS